MFQIIDISGWTKLTPEQMGTKPKFWCLDPEGEECLFKESRSHSGEHWSEKLAAEIAEELGLPHAKIELAVCCGKSGTLSRNFMENPMSSSLEHGNQLLFRHDPNYPKDGPNFGAAAHTFSRIFSVLDEQHVGLPSTFRGQPECVRSAGEVFVGYLLLDALINNTDRHHENWAIIVSQSADHTRRAELAPTFDHASSLGRELTDDRRAYRMNAEAMRNDKLKPARRDQTIAGYLSKNDGRSRIYASEQDTKALHPMQVFEQARQRFPLAGDAWIDCLSAIPFERFEEQHQQVPLEIMSQIARDFSLRLLELSRAALVSRRFQHD